MTQSVKNVQYYDALCEVVTSFIIQGGKMKHKQPLCDTVTFNKKEQSTRSSSMDHELQLFSAERENICSSRGPLTGQDPRAEPHSISLTHQETIDDLLYIFSTRGRPRENGGGDG